RRAHASVVSSTLRPRYSPQWAQARCRSMGASQFGQVMKLAGRKASCARRLLRFVVDVRRFGTAMNPSPARSGVAVDLEIAERRPARIALLDHARALAGIAIASAPGTEPPALFTTEWPRGQGEHDLLVHEGREVDLRPFVERLREVAGRELDLARERRSRNEHQGEL